MGKVLNSPAQAWSESLLLQLRLRDVPGARIGEVLAEVESHVAETGEDPQQAFGSPKEYADEVAAALGIQVVGLWAQLRRGLTWRDLLTATLTGLATFCLGDGLWSLGAGTASLFGLPAWAVCAVGAALLVACTARFVVAARHEPDGDPVRDPRTGADMVPLDGWKLVLLAVLPVALLATMAVGGYLTR